MPAGCLSSSLGAMAAGLAVPIFIISGSSGLRLAFQRSLFRGLFLLSNTTYRSNTYSVDRQNPVENTG